MQGADHAPSEPLEGNEKYEKVRDINRGSYGFVQLARDRQDGQQVAVSTPAL
jgi:serine/threonine-protein kinase SRK2